jgi:hypothetical protein
MGEPPSSARTKETEKTMRKPWSIQDPKDGRTLFHCKRCEAYLPRDRFYECSLAHRTRLCRPCNAVVSVENHRKNNNRYRRLLHNLKRQHRGSREAIRLTEEDARVLIDEFWQNRSPIGTEAGRKEAEDGKEESPMGFALWLPNEPPNPWNLVLLTPDQKRLHARGQLDCSEEESKRIHETLERIRCRYDGKADMPP